MVTMQECMEFSVSYFHLPRGMYYYYTLHSGRTIAYIPTCTTSHMYVTMYATIILYRINYWYIHIMLRSYILWFIYIDAIYISD